MFESLPTSTAQHPIQQCAGVIGRALDEVTEVDPLYMSPAEKQSALLTVQRDLDRLAELQLRVLATADDVAKATGARDAGSWLATTAGLDRPEGQRRRRLALALRDTQPLLADALRGGTVTVDQAHVIRRAVEQLPDDLDPAVREQALKQLVADAADHSPRQLRRLGRKILEVVAPEVAEEHERKLVEREEALARRLSWLTIRDLGDGTSSIRGRLSSAAAGRLRTYLDAIASPRRDQDDARDADRAPYDVRLGRAFTHLLEQWDPARLPVHGGAATTVVVTIDLESLHQGLGVATTSSGEVISAGEARRLACSAGLLPLVLGGNSEVLDLGRTRRLFSPAQRKAMVVRDQHCRADGCDVPAAWCEAHHRHPWSAGGRTDLADGVLLCSWHHHRVHDPAYRHRLRPDGSLTFHRRT
ncbi:HNH endonuclease signature motif containing protein [Nocardioides aestuarii]|uniref:DUF222 domain-containing protein n=1 Tax=Nocardioides aestuarii TaxID=252231 RepID=A0ABW4TJS7_9ACTN